MDDVLVLGNDGDHGGDLVVNAVSIYKSYNEYTMDQIPDNP